MSPRKRRKGNKEYLKVESFPHLKKDILQPQEAQQISSRINSEIHTETHCNETVKRQRQRES